MFIIDINFDGITHQTVIPDLESVKYARVFALAKLAALDLTEEKSQILLGEQC